MGKRDTSKGADPHSLRSKRRAKRGFTMSRPNRRAQKRLSSAQRDVTPGMKAEGMNMPGAINHW